MTVSPLSTRISSQFPATEKEAFKLDGFSSGEKDRQTKGKMEKVRLNINGHIYGTASKRRRRKNRR